MNDLFTIHARTIKGLESILSKELHDLGAKNIHTATGLVTFQGDKALLYQANLWCRTAIRIQKPLKSFQALDQETLYKEIRKIDWSKYLRPEGTLAVDTKVSSSFTSHSLFVAQLVKDAIVDQFRDNLGTRPSVDLNEPDVRIAVRILDNQVQVSLDASGHSLHLRGYKTQATEAPISEVLAAGILKLSDWNPKTPLVDPMCGSGTFLIEAGLIANDIAPGLFRKAFGFQTWLDYDEDLFQELKGKARAKIKKTKAVLIGSDQDDRAVEIAKSNIQRAGLGGQIEVTLKDFFKTPAPLEEPATLLMNPPYDERLDLANSAQFYQQIGDKLKEAYAGWSTWIFTGNLSAAKFIGLRSEKRIALYNGPIECRLLEFEIRGGGKTLERKDHPEWLQKAEVLANRIKKNYKHASKVAKRTGQTTFKIYDWDIPDLPFTITYENGKITFKEIPRNYSHTPADHPRYLKLMQDTVTKVVNPGLES